MGRADNVATAALDVALVAGLVALVQVAQQYAGTANLIRKCDSVVYGPLPGRGKREFVWRQLRFKVVFFVPQVSLSERLWPNMTDQSPSYSPSTKSLAPIVQKQWSPTISRGGKLGFFLQGG